MRRRTFDALAATAGLVIAAILLVAGVLLLWGHNFTTDQVHNQLAKQQIFFPPKAAFAHPKAGTEITPSMIPSVSQYAGQQLLTGPQAETYANDFIAVHLFDMPYHGVYATISGLAYTHPTNATYKALEQTSFQGTTLRGLLLEAYGFWKLGQIAMWGAIVSFIGAGLMLILSILGFVHLRRTPAEQMFPKKMEAVKATA
jgi:hypothetical protein